MRKREFVCWWLVWLVAVLMAGPVFAATPMVAAGV